MSFLLSVFASYAVMILQFFVLYRLYGHTLTYKYNPKYRFLSILLPLLISIIRFHISLAGLIHNSISDLAAMAVLYISVFLCGILFYSDSIASKFLWTIIYFLIIALCEVLTLIIFQVFGFSSTDLLQSEALYYSSGLISKAAAFIPVELIRPLRKKTLMFPRFARLEIISIIFINLFLIVYSVYIFHSDTTALSKNTVLSLLFLLCFLISVLTFVIIFRLSGKAEEDLEEKLLIQQLEMENKLNNDMTNVVEKLRSLRHDMNNHVLVLQNLVHSKQYDILQEYLDDMCGEVSPANDFIFIKNKALSALLYNKSLNARLKNIEFETVISVDGFDIPDKDMCTLLGNLLDNAIEAAEKVLDNKYIQLILSKKDSDYYIECSNTFREMPVIVKNTFITSKVSKELHGFGMKNIQSIVHKYSGTMEYSYYDLFKVKITLPCFFS